jgi:hypothetical protein
MYLQNIKFYLPMAYLLLRLLIVKKVIATANGYKVFSRVEGATMKHLTYFSVLLGLVFVFASCGNEPTDVGTSGSDLSWKKPDNNNRNKHKRMVESFEAYTDGSIMPDKYNWVKGGKALGKVTKKDLRDNKKQSLELEIPQDSSTATYLGSKFCLSESVGSYLHAKFSLKFANFVNWTAFGASDGTTVQYWWWVRSDGSIFDDTTFDSFAMNTWQDAELVIDRNQNLATVTIAGRTHYVELTSAYQYTDHSAPMQCLFVFASSDGTAQSLLIDDIRVIGD